MIEQILFWFTIISLLLLWSILHWKMLCIYKEVMLKKYHVRKT